MRFTALPPELECPESIGEITMSKYEALWNYINSCGKDALTLTFDEIGKICGVSIDHSFLRYKKELTEYGYEVSKISMKLQTVLFIRKEEHI